MPEKTITVSKTVVLYPQGDKNEVKRVYEYIRNGMRIQSQMMNICMSAMYSAKLRGADKDEMRELSYLHSHVPTSKKGSAYHFDMKYYPVGLPIAGSIPHTCKKLLNKSIKDGLLRGKVSLPTFKNTMPLMVHNDFVSIRGSKTRSTGAIIDTGIYHDYDTPGEFVDALKKEVSPKLHIKFANDIIFDVIFGSPVKSREIRSVFEKIFSGEYKVCDSSIGFDKKTGKKIILHLAIAIPVPETKLDENVCVGVDLGLAVPAVCALNNNVYKKLYIGSYNDFTRKRTQIQEERRRISRQCKVNHGGHGRKDKLKHLEKISLHEREFAHTYNHMVSKNVIEFAEKNHAMYINLESLKFFSEDDKSNFVLRNWSYYELQQMIKAKAAAKNMVVKFINPAYTSQTCSVCGQKGIRSEQSLFICENPDCECHTLYEKYGLNADFNAARNIAMSKDYVEDEDEDDEEVKDAKAKKKKSTRKSDKKVKDIGAEKTA